mmetsp:Transcript_45763/g.38547  ORF Transcript_45763/g.38547 Transcript_45763/m.38547 type:complete len:122 (+) Transcript_45763:2517-2882(+)
MVVGPRGIGTTTHIDMACEEFKLKTFKLHSSFLQKFEEDTLARKNRRKYQREYKEEEEEELDDPLKEEEEEYGKWKESVARKVWNMNPDYNVERNGVLIDGNYINAEGRETEFFQETIDLL